MKRRVGRQKENKKGLRTLRAACGTAPPFVVFVDASFIRAASDGKVASLSTLMHDSLDAECNLHYCPATRRVLEKSSPKAISLLYTATESNWGATERDQNETKALSVALKHKRQKIVFLATVSHDVRTAASSWPGVVLLNFTASEGFVRVDHDSVTRVSAHQGTEKPVITVPTPATRSLNLLAKDKAFLKKLASDKLVSLPKEPEPLDMKAAAAQAARAAARERRRRSDESKRSHANPLSCKKRKAPEGFVSSDL